MSTLQKITAVFLAFVGLAFLKTGLEAILDPQTVMDYVQVTLDNASARNSIRSFYGFVNAALGLFMIFGAFRMQREALALSLLYAGSFTMGRLYGLAVDGLASDFIYTWMITEAIVAICSMSLLLARRNKPEAAAARNMSFAMFSL